MENLTGKSVDRYQILELLGQGGMAMVYKAYDPRLEREVALKIIRLEAFPPDDLQDVRKRFEREAKALAQLSHPNIIKVMDYGEHEGSPFLVMEHLQGGTLKQMIGEPMSWQEAMRLLIPIARGLEYAHRRGIVHRDIKPANILMTEDGEPTLSDFGIVKLFQGEKTALTASGAAVGTPEYMAPEQWTGKTSPKSDIYSIGIVLYEIITGRRPYNADTPGELFLKQVTEPLPLPREIVPDLPESVEKFFLKVLDKDPSERHNDFGAFIREIENLLTEKSSRAQPVELEVSKPVKGSKTDANRKVPSRRWVGVVVVAIVLIGVILGGVFGITPLLTQPENTPEPTQTIQKQSPTNTLTATAEITSTPEATSTPNITATPTFVPNVSVLSYGQSEDGTTPDKLPDTYGFIGNQGDQLSILLIGMGAEVWIRDQSGNNLTFFGNNRGQIYSLSSSGTYEFTLPYSGIYYLDVKNRGDREGFYYRVTISLENNTFSLPNEITDEFDVGSTWTRPLDGMVMMYVPAGEFSMGSDDGDPDEQPVHNVFLDAFWIDQTEVTNIMYVECMDSGECDDSGRGIRSLAENNPNYPVNGHWDMANSYCNWAGARLPTEAEWEKAARGSLGGKKFPWGDEEPTCKAGEINGAHFELCSGWGMVDVKTFAPNGFGLYDMAGNAREWTADWYDPNYYSNSPFQNPQGPSSGNYRVIRGASWVDHDDSSVRSANRLMDNPTELNSDIGFRCARNMAP